MSKRTIARGTAPGKLAATRETHDSPQRACDANNKHGRSNSDLPFRKHQGSEALWPCELRYRDCGDVYSIWNAWPFYVEVAWRAANISLCLHVCFVSFSRRALIIRVAPSQRRVAWVNRRQDFHHSILGLAALPTGFIGDTSRQGCRRGRISGVSGTVTKMNRYDRAAIAGSRS